MLFCPYCGTQLFLECAGRVRYYCRTCPYKQDISELDDQMHVLVEEYTPKKAEDILGGPSQFKHLPSTEILCTKEACGNQKAYFRQIQIRSGDEPMTTFYCCTECGEIWRQD